MSYVTDSVSRVGFASLAKKESNIGSFGLLQQSDFAPLTTSFPWPDLDTLPAIFDRFVVNALDENLDAFANPGTALGSAFTSNNLFFNGANAIAGNAGIKPKLYAPASFSLGSSILHLNESTYPTGNVNEMMTPFGAAGNANHNPGPIVFGVLRDIGWNLNPDLAVNSLMANKLSVFPNPASNDLVVTTNLNTHDYQVNIHDLAGKLLIAESNFESNEKVDVSKLVRGYYFITIQNSHEILKTSFIKH
jgi:hypothetical protein